VEQDFPPQECDRCRCSLNTATFREMGKFGRGEEGKEEVFVDEEVVKKTIFEQVKPQGSWAGVEDIIEQKLEKAISNL
jgi:hypothetical protein